MSDQTNTQETIQIDIFEKSLTSAFLASYFKISFKNIFFMFLDFILLF